MESPYRPPQAQIASSVAQRRYAHAVAVFLGGWLIGTPLFLLLIAKVMPILWVLLQHAPMGRILHFAATSAVVSMLVAGATYPLKRLPIWAAIVCSAMLVPIALCVLYVLYAYLNTLMAH